MLSTVFCYSRYFNNISDDWETWSLIQLFNLLLASSFHFLLLVSGYLVQVSGHNNDWWVRGSSLQTVKYMPSLLGHQNNFLVHTSPTYMQLHKHTHMCTCKHTHMSCTHARAQTHAHTRTHTRTHTRMYTHTHTRMHTHTHTHTRAHAHTHAK